MTMSWLVLPHPHSALSRRPVTILPRELQQAVFVTHHPVFTEHSFFLQPEHVVQLSRRGTLPMIVGFSGPPVARSGDCAGRCNAPADKHWHRHSRSEERREGKSG